MSILKTPNSFYSIQCNFTKAKVVKNQIMNEAFSDSLSKEFDQLKRFLVFLSLRCIINFETTVMTSLS